MNKKTAGTLFWEHCGKDYVITVVLAVGNGDNCGMGR